jgi:hypothetical protein
MGIFGSFCELITRQAQSFRTFQTVCPYKTRYRRSGLHERRNYFRHRGMLFPPGGKAFPRLTNYFRRSCNPQKITRLRFDPTPYWYSVRPMVHFHWWAGRFESQNRSYRYFIISSNKTLILRAVFLWMASFADSAM